MRDWKGLAALGIGIAIGAGLWLGLSRLPPSDEASPVMAETAPVAAEGITGATTPAAPEPAVEEEDEIPVPFVVEARAEELQALLESAPYVHRAATGPALYVVSFRTCPSCALFRDKEWASLEAAGADLRWITYARRDRAGVVRSNVAERAVVAELNAARDYALFEAWYRVSADEFYQTAALPPPAESTPERMSALEFSRALVDALSAVCASNAQELAIPAFFWRAGDTWRGMIGYDETAFATVKAELFATPAAEAEPNPAPNGPEPPEGPPAEGAPPAN